MITTRQAIISDNEQIAVLSDCYRQFYHQAPDILLAKTFITKRIKNHESVIFVAETLTENSAENDAKQLIGFCQIYPSFCSVAAAKIGVLYDLFVIETARKTGAGRALMLAAHDYAANNGMARLDLSIAKNNYAAQSLYESLGWQRDDIFYTYSKDIN